MKIRNIVVMIMIFCLAGIAVVMQANSATTKKSKYVVQLTKSENSKLAKKLKVSDAKMSAAIKKINTKIVRVDNADLYLENVADKLDMDTDTLTEIIDSETDLQDSEDDITAEDSLDSEDNIDTSGRMDFDEEDSLLFENELLQEQNEYDNIVNALTDEQVLSDLSDETEEETNVIVGMIQEATRDTVDQLESKEQTYFNKYVLLLSKELKADKNKVAKSLNSVM